MRVVLSLKDLNDFLSFTLLFTQLANIITIPLGYRDFRCSHRYQYFLCSYRYGLSHAAININISYLLSISIFLSQTKKQSTFVQGTFLAGNHV